MDLWIGDYVRNSKTGNTGRYEGPSGTKARVRIGEKIFLIPNVNLELLSDEEIEAHKKRLDKKSGKGKERKVKKPKKEVLPEMNSIDLHIDKLAPHLEGKQPELILIRQMEAARSFVENAINRRVYSITLIHGKGTGALKMEIEHLLKEYDQVYFTIEVNRGGATELLFRY